MSTTEEIEYKRIGNNISVTEYSQMISDLESERLEQELLRNNQLRASSIQPIVEELKRINSELQELKFLLRDHMI